jgi:GGDEF domain-containing protein
VAPGLAVTISAGVAQAGAHPTHEKLLAEADARLYDAKRRGKDCVVASAEGGASDAERGEGG